MINMNVDVQTALIAVAGGLLGAVLSHVFSRWSTSADARSKLIYAELNPLRLHCVEAELRLDEILRYPKGHPGLQYLDAPEDLSAKEARWFVEHGCFTGTTMYCIAGLLHHVWRMRNTRPYVKLAWHKGDAQLLTKLMRVSVAFTRAHGIYYLTQSSVGHAVLAPDSSDELATYKDFVRTLQDPKERIWLDRLAQVLIEAGRGENLDRLRMARTALEDLARFLDVAVGGESAREARRHAEESSG